MVREYFAVEPSTLQQTKDSMDMILQQAEAELRTLDTTTQELNAAWQGPSNQTFRAVFQQDYMRAVYCCRELRSRIACLERDAQAYQSCESDVLQRVQRL